MAVTYASPGVYVEEVDRGTKPIEAVGTSLTAFIGITAEASRKVIDPATGERVPGESVTGKPVLVTNWTQFTDVFGGLHSSAYVPDAVYGYFANGGGPCYVVSLRALDEMEDAASTASATIPASGRGKSFSVEAKSAGPEGNDLVVTIKHDAAGEGEEAAKAETFSMTVGDAAFSGLSMKKDDANYIGKADLKHVNVTDAGTSMPEEGSYRLEGGGVQPLDVDDFVGDAEARLGLGGLEALDELRLIACPDLMTGYDGSDAAKERIKAVQTAIIAHCENLRYRFAILDTPPGLSASEAKAWREYVNFDTSYAAMYYPWVVVPDLTGSGKTSRLMPPSGHVAGIYNRVDGERGTHKAPANEVLLSTLDLEHSLTRGEQDQLNPLGINCLRAFPGRGIRVWGARTLSSDGSWRYINVRRLFILVGASLEQGMQWVVFEPNDSTLWAKVRRDVTAFLRNIWRSGALFGTTPDQAFYVKCDEELNPPEVRDVGQLIIEIGLAPVKPAEFVIIRISQWAGPNAEA